MTDEKNKGQGGGKENGRDKGTYNESTRTIRDNSKKSDNTVSYDRPTPQRPKKD